MAARVIGCGELIFDVQGLLCEQRPGTARVFLPTRLPAEILSNLNTSWDCPLFETASCYRFT